MLAVALLASRTLGDFFVPLGVAGASAVLLGIVANFASDAIRPILGRLTHPSDSAVRRFLETIEERATNFSEIADQLGTTNYFQVVFDTRNLVQATDLAERVRARLDREQLAAMTPAEAALLVLFCTKVKTIDTLLDRAFEGKGFQEVLPLFERAAENRAYQFLNLTLSLSGFFDSAAAGIAILIRQRGKILGSSHWRRLSDNSFAEHLDHASHEHLIVGVATGQTNQLHLDYIASRPEVLSKVHFLLASPLCVSRSTLRQLALEYTAPSVFREPFFFVEHRGRFTLDYLRRVFKILLNCGRLVRLSDGHPELEVAVSFYGQGYPGASIRVLRQAKVVQVHTGALDVQKHLSRFAAEIRDREIADAIVCAIESKRGSSAAQWNPWQPSGDNLETLTRQGLRELVVFLHSCGITRQDVEEEEARIRLVLKESGPQVDGLFYQTYKLFDWLANGPS